MTADMQDKAIVTEAYAAATIDDTGCEYLGRDVAQIEAIAKTNGNEVIYLIPAALSVEKAPAVETPPPGQHVEAPKPTAWLTKIYSNDGVLLDTRLDFVKPVIMSTAKTEFVPLFATTVTRLAAASLPARH